MHSRMIGSRKTVPPRMLQILLVRALPHLLQLELLHARLVRRDRRALDPHFVLQDCLGRVDGHLVVCL